MRALVVLMAISFGVNSFAAKTLPHRIHVWQCSSVAAGPDRGFSVGIVEDSRKGTMATVSTQTIAGPKSIGEYRVSFVNPTVARGSYIYLDKPSMGRDFTLSITSAGQGQFHAVDARGHTRRGKVRCYRTRNL